MSPPPPPLSPLLLRLLLKERGGRVWVLTADLPAA
jgi:hypothetical protein